MRKLSFAIAVVAAMAIAAPASAAHVITLSNTAPTGTTVFEDFDAMSPMAPLGPNAFTYDMSVSGVAAMPTGSTGNFAAVLGGGSATFTLPTPSFMFSFLLGSLDSYNSLTLTFDDATTATLAGSAITNGLGSDGYVTYDYTLTGKRIVSATFASSQNSFEFDNLAAGAVPEPATWAMLILGFGLVGGAMRRRTRTSVAFA